MDAIPLGVFTGPCPLRSPDDRLIVYAGEDVAGRAPLLGVRPDGTPVTLPTIRVASYSGEPYRFLPDGTGLIYVQGFGTAQNFWLLDLTTNTTRQLTRLTNTATIRSFDISPDGKQIVFDRLRENSDIVLIDLRK